METSAVVPQIDPNTGERVVTRTPAAPRIDPSTGERIVSQGAPITTDVGQDAWKAGVHAKMLGVTPGFAYQNRDEISKQMHDKGGDYDTGELDPTIMNDIKVGYENSIHGLYESGKLPETVKNPGMIDRFVTGLTQMVEDLPVMVAGGLAGGAVGIAAGSEVPIIGNITAGGAGAAAGAFAAPAGVREALVEGIKKGKIENFSDLLHRAADVTWATTKGAVTGVATELAGGIPVGGFIAKSGAASIGMKGLYQAAALTTAADLLEGKLPSAGDFAGNAALVVPLNLITHGIAMRSGEAKQALMDTYAKDGKTPQETVDKLNAQPPVKPDLPPGLRPAIKFGNSYIDGNDGESHDELAERLGVKPVTMGEIQADPTLALQVLENPEIHAQDVIDAAWIQWDDMLISSKFPRQGQAGREEIDIQRLQAQKGNLKSGRGFVTPDGKFLSREQAPGWVKKNEPDVHEMWGTVTGDPKAEFHSGDYGEARERVQNRNVAEGESAYDSMSNELAKFWAWGRSVLNGIKAGEKGAEYGDSAVRTLLVGPHNMFVVEAAQIVGRLRTMVPDVVDQRAISFMRDYRENPEALRSSIEEIRSGSNERLKAYIPSMERALSPTPEMMQADQHLTEYFKGALDRERQMGIMDSSIDPSRYSPRMFVKAVDEAKKGIGRPNFTEKTPHAIQRKYLNLLDPLKSGDFEARTFNAFDELAIYGDRHATAMSTKLFTTELKNSALGLPGTEDSHPEGWQPLRGSGGLYVPKVIADALAPMLENGGKPSAVAKFLHVQQLTKAIELGLSFFHIKAMGITAMNNMSVDGYVRAIHSDNSSPDFEAQERRHALYGLTTTKTGPEYEAYRGSHPSDIPTGFDKFTNLPVIKQVDAIAKSITKTTFDVIQRKFKVTDMSAKEASWVTKHPDASAQEYGSAMRSIAKEVNAAYGGLNWDVMGVSKSMRDMYRMFLLAPDWTFSNIANVKYAFQGGAAGSASRTFFVKSFVTGFAMTAGMSQAIGKKYDPTDIKHLDMVYLGKDKDGKDMYVNMFFAGAPKDLMTWVKKSMSDTPLAGTAEYIVNKAAPLVGTIGHLAMNEEYGGKPIYKKTEDFGSKLKDQAEYTAERLAPISGVSAVETVKKALTDPNHEWSYKDLLELAGNALGMQVSHEKDPSQAGPAGKESRLLPGMAKRSKSKGMKLQ